MCLCGVAWRAGANLLRLSELDLTLALYRDRIFPQVVTRLVESKDKMAQEYLLDCVVNVFPDEFQLHTLGPFLAAVATLQGEGAHVLPLVGTLLARLAATCAARKADGHEPLALPADAFALLSRSVAELSAGRPGVPPVSAPEALGLYSKLAAFCAAFFPGQVAEADAVLAEARLTLARLASADSASESGLDKAADPSPARPPHVRAPVGRAALRVGAAVRSGGQPGRQSCRMCAVLQGVLRRPPSARLHVCVTCVCCMCVCVCVCVCVHVCVACVRACVCVCLRWPHCWTSRRSAAWRCAWPRPVSRPLRPF
jgi:hypothetical protein